MIEKLTPAQEAQIPKYRDEYMKIGLSTEPCDRAKAEQAISDSYEYLGFKRPTFRWVDSPFVALREAAKKVTKKAEVTKQDIMDQRSKASFGSLEAYWVGFYAYIAEVLPVKKDKLIDIVKAIVKDSGVYLTFEDEVIISEKPVAIHMKDNKLHNPDGLALEFKDGTGIFAIEGKTYPSLMEMTIQQEAEKVRAKDSK